MNKFTELLGKAKEYITIAIEYLGKLLGLVKSAEEQFKDEDKK